MSPLRSETPGRGSAWRRSLPIPRARAAGRQASGCASSCLSVIPPVAPDIARIDALRRLVFAPVGIARRHHAARGLTPGLAVIELRRRTPGIARRRRIIARLALVEEAERI